MTKEELDRIKEAYYSGLKVQIWFDGHWENFDIRDYSMYPEPFSENRQYRIVGSDYADMAEKRIKDLVTENERIKTKYYELQETLKKVRLALIQERTANIMNYVNGGVEMFDSMFEILKGVSN